MAEYGSPAVPPGNVVVTTPGVADGVIAVDVTMGAGDVVSVQGTDAWPTTGNWPVKVTAPGMKAAVPSSPAVNGPTDTGAGAMVAGWPSVKVAENGSGVAAALIVAGVASEALTSSSVTVPVSGLVAPTEISVLTKLAGMIIWVWYPVTVRGSPPGTLDGDEPVTLAANVVLPSTGTAHT